MVLLVALLRETAPGGYLYMEFATKVRVQNIPTPPTQKAPQRALFPPLVFI